MIGTRLDICKLFNPYNKEGLYYEPFRDLEVESLCSVT